jgi:TolB-like protein
MIGPLHKSGSTSGSSREGTPAAEPMVQTIIARQLSTLAQDVAPHTVKITRNLEKETSPDKAIKQKAKNAEALAKSGNYRAAEEAYLGIYQDSKSFAAAFNAGLLMQAGGDLERAAALMQRVSAETGNPQANAELARIRSEMGAIESVAAYSENQGQRDRLIALMVDTLPANLPRNAKIAIINNSQNERELADSITNGIITGFLAKNITVVDRSNQSLVETERNYQYSGNVSDADLISIGNEAGVNTFILVSVTGSYSTRRLLVRMLDVERNIIVYQSPQTDEMNL